MGLQTALLPLMFITVKVIAVSGNQNTGKSTLCNLGVQFFENAEKGQPHLLGPNPDPDAEFPALFGFQAENSDEPTTAGIWIWSKLFQIRNKSGYKYALMLMDTEGQNSLNQQQQITQKCSNKVDGQIFCLSSLASSIQIYLAPSQILRSEMSSISTFSKYGIMVNDRDGWPFAKLFLLRRDNEDAGDDSNTVARCFGDTNLATGGRVACYKLQHAGQAFKSRDLRKKLKEGKCPIREVGIEFIRSLENFFNKLVSVDNLKKLVVDNRADNTKPETTMTCEQLYQQFKRNFESIERINDVDPEDFPSLYACIHAKTVAVQSIKKMLEQYDEKCQYRQKLKDFNEQVGKIVGVALGLYKLEHWNMMRRAAGGTGAEREQLLRQQNFCQLGTVLISKDLKALYSEHKAKNDQKPHENFYKKIVFAVTGGGVSSVIFWHVVRMLLTSVGFGVGIASVLLVLQFTLPQLSSTDFPTEIEKEVVGKKQLEALFQTRVTINGDNFELHDSEGKLIKSGAVPTDETPTAAGR